MMVLTILPAQTGGSRVLTEITRDSTTPGIYIEENSEISERMALLQSYQEDLNKRILPSGCCFYTHQTIINNNTFIGFNQKGGIKFFSYFHDFLLLQPKDAQLTSPYTTNEEQEIHFDGIYDGVNLWYERNGFP